MYRWRVLVLGAGMERTCRLDTGDQSKWAMSRPLVPKREDRNGGPRRYLFQPIRHSGV